MTGTDNTPTDGIGENRDREDGPVPENQPVGEPDQNDDGDRPYDLDNAEEAPGIDWREGPDLPPPAAVSGFGTAGAVNEPDQLALGDDDVRLPWLEAGEDDEADAGSNSAQLLGFLGLGLLALAVIVGAIWWATRRQADDTLVADGSVITAPAAPYKERPKDPGGKTFAGTGDTSFAVSEGQTRTTRLGQGDAAPTPGFVTAPKPSEAAAAAAGAKPAGTATAAAAATGGIGVQVGAFSTKATAEAGWAKLQQQYSALSGLSHRVVEGRADIGTVYRLQAVAADAAAARSLCGQLRTAGLGCQVKN